MHNLAPSRLARVAACRADLLANGVDLAAAPRPQLRSLVGEHLAYFHSMLGDESTVGQVVSLVRREMRLAGRRIARALAASRTATYDDPASDRLARRRRDMAHMTLDELAAMGREVHRRADAVKEDLTLLHELTELHLRECSGLC